VIWLITLPSDCCAGLQAAQRLPLWLFATCRGPHPLDERCVITLWFCTGRILPELVFPRLSDGHRNLQTLFHCTPNTWWCNGKHGLLIAFFQVVCSARVVTTSRSVTCFTCKTDTLSGLSKVKATNPLLTIQTKNSLQWSSWSLLLKRGIVPSAVV